MSADQPEVCLRQKESDPEPHRGALCCNPGCSQGGAPAQQCLRHSWHTSGCSTGSAVLRDTPKNRWRGKLPCWLMEGISLSAFFLVCELWVVCLGFLKAVYEISSFKQPVCLWETTGNKCFVAKSRYCSSAKHIQMQFGPTVWVALFK